MVSSVRPVSLERNRLLLDVHHKLKNEYLQYYLNELCYKFNRRYLNEKLLDRLMFTTIIYNIFFR